MRSLKDLLDEIITRIKRVEGIIGDFLEPNEDDEYEDDEEMEEDEED